MCVLAYSDLPNQKVMELAAGVQALGTDFMLLGPNSTQLKSRKPVIAITAVRTGSGKSQITDYVAEFLTKINVKYTVVRHPMPYGNLEIQRVQIRTAICNRNWTDSWGSYGCDGSLGRLSGF